MRVDTDAVLKEEENEEGEYHMYGGRFRKSAIRTYPPAEFTKSLRKTCKLVDKPVKNSYPSDSCAEIQRDLVGLGGGGRHNACQVLDKMSERGVLVKKEKKMGSLWSDKMMVLSKVYKENDCRVKNAPSCSGFEDKFLVFPDEEMEEMVHRREMLDKFRELYDKVAKKEKGKFKRIDLLAWEMMVQNEKDLMPVKTIGPIRGVEVGERFNLRAELAIMGIHFHLIHGIDYLETFPPNSQLLATSVVATEGYDDNTRSPDVVEYRGEGGGSFESERHCKKKVKNQVLKNGNLALKNSCREKNDVRVVRGVKHGRSGKTRFVYDGVYKVVDYKEKAGPCGKMQFLFTLHRCPGQKRIVWAQYK